MAYFTLHYILFSVIKLINPHILLTESYPLIWSTSQAKESVFNQTLPFINGWPLDKQRYNYDVNNTDEYGPTKTNSEFLYTHSSIYLIALSSFIVIRSNTFNRAKQYNSYREYLINLFSLAILFKIIYIYTINTLADSNPETFSTPSRLIHTLVLITLIIGQQWTYSNIGAISETLAVDYCIQHSKPLGVHYNFINYLMLGTFGLAIMSVCLFEGFLIKALLFGSEKVRFTNVVQTITLLCFVIELACLLLITHDREENQKVYSRCLRYSSEGSATTKEVYSLSDNSTKFPVSLSKQEQMSWNTVDEDEVDLFYIRSIPSLKTNVQENIAFQNTKDAFDRDKYSLYDDFQLINKRDFSLNLRIDSNQNKTCYSVDNERINFKKMTVFEQLILGDSGFIRRIVALSIIGAIFQANQQCILSEYLKYIMHESPKEFENYLLETANQQLSSEANKMYEFKNAKTISQVKTCAIWIELICLSYLVQCSARIFCLHHVHSLTTRFGLENSLYGLLIACPVFIAQFAFNYYLLQNKISGLSNGYLTFIIICHLMIIQIQIGLLSAFIDYIINDLTLQFSQLVVNLRADSSSVKEKEESKIELVRCTVHNILGASFFHIGSALMAAGMLLFNLFLGRYQSMRYEEIPGAIPIFMSIAPIFSLLIFATILYLKRREFKSQKML